MLSHHAYYIEDALSKWEDYQHKVRVDEGYGENDPNFVTRVYEKFGIDEARGLIELSSLRNTGARAVYFLTAASMTSEAQQALLKLFEEPQQGTTYILLVPHGTLIPTLKSRFMAFPRKVEAEASTTGQAREFLASPYKKRSDWIAATLKEEEDSRERVRTFLNELEGELYTKIGQGHEYLKGLEEIQHFRQYLSDRSPSLKMILEHFAATLPTVK
jgi:DNA polymerase III delta prime subunit